MRKNHFLKDNKSQASPRYVIFFDSESRVLEDGTHLPYLICAEFYDLQNIKAYTQKSYMANNLSEFWKDVANHGKKEKCAVWTFAHNAGYDTLATKGIPSLCEEGFRVNSFFEKGSTYVLSLRKEVGASKKTINIISSTNFYATTLAQLGEIFGINKMEFDYNSSTDAEALEYCRRDVEILRTAMLKFMEFVKKENLGVLAKTTPGQAFNAYRHRFMPHKIALHNHEEATKLERNAYYGGRVECLKIGEFEGDFFGLDFNAMYPYHMQQHKYPTAMKGYRKYGKLSDMESFIKQGYLICAKVKINTKEPVFPLKINDNLLFPIGTFWTYLTTPEILYALNNRMLEDVDSFAFYEGANIFTDYVDYFQTKRQEAKNNNDKIHDMLYKMFSNSLYGKFGQISEHWTRIADTPIESVWAEDVYNKDTKEINSYKCFGGSVFSKSKEVSEAVNSFCAISAHVTAYARMYLYEHVKIAGKENVLYMDTDSIFCNALGAKRLYDKEPFSETKLGALKLEKKDSKIKINAPKDYQFAGVTKMKGVKKGSTPIGDSGRIFINTYWPKLFSCINDGNISQYKNIKRTKVLKGEYIKGWVLENGDVIPLEILHDKIIPFSPSPTTRLQNSEQHSVIFSKLSSTI